MNKILLGDCLVRLKELPDNSVDSVVTDPPAGIGFMMRSWDSNKGGRDNWIDWMTEVAYECKRVLKPGGHAFVWSIPRTSHWTTISWENAGFEVRDVIAHVFGSGFPKSHNIGVAVDKLLGNEREKGKLKFKGGTQLGVINDDGWKPKDVYESKGTSEWEGWGTALKPAREDWILLRKKLEKGLSIAENCLKWGTGGINIDESRVDTITEADKNNFHQNRKVVKEYKADDTLYELGMKTVSTAENSLGRFPANLIHDNSEEVREFFPETKSGGISKNYKQNSRFDVGEKGKGGNLDESNCFNDSGNASRYFKSILYYPKASKSERNKGCEGLEKGNNHPTIKNLRLMEYLIKMITPKGGIVLDPFAGSGTTGVACVKNNYQYVLIEMEEEYVKIIEARIKPYLKQEEKQQVYIPKYWNTNRIYTT